MIELAVIARVKARALKDSAFRQQVLNDPKRVLASEYNVQFPEHIMLRVLEETAQTITIVLPPQAEPLQELADADLEAIAGGIEIPTTRGINCGDWR